MAKHEETLSVYDQKKGIERIVKLEIKAPQFILDCMEHGKFDSALVAQEAYDMPAKKFTIDVSVTTPRR